MFKTVPSLQARPHSERTLNTENEGNPATLSSLQHASLISWHSKSIDKWQLNATRPTSQCSKKREMSLSLSYSLSLTLSHSFSLSYSLLLSYSLIFCFLKKIFFCNFFCF